MFLFPVSTYDDYYNNDVDYIQFLLKCSDKGYPKEEIKIKLCKDEKKLVPKVLFTFWF